MLLTWNVRSCIRLYYSETTWAGGIAQLTHHEVQGGGKIPRPKVEGFLPPPRTEWWVNCAIPTAHVVLLLSHTLFGQPFVFLKAWQFLKTAKEHINFGERQRPLNWTCRYGDATIFTCDVIMVPVVTRAPNITNISCRKIAPKPLVYIDPRILLNYYTFISGKTI